MVGPFSGSQPSVVQAACGRSVQWWPSKCGTGRLWLVRSVVANQVWYRPLVVGPFSGSQPSVVQATCGWSVQW